MLPLSLQREVSYLHAPEASSKFIGAEGLSSLSERLKRALNAMTYVFADTRSSRIWHGKHPELNPRKAVREWRPKSRFRCAARCHRAPVGDVRNSVRFPTISH